MPSQQDLFDRFPQMKPIKRMPTLSRVNGCGVALYGSRDHDAQTGTYVKTWCISLAFIPVICLKAYRVASGRNGGWFILGREPLSAFAKAWNVIVLAGALSIGGGVMWNNYTSTPEYKAKQRMAAADGMVNAGKLASAASTYENLTSGGTTQADPAAHALASLLDAKCPQAPLSEDSGVYEAAVHVARQNDFSGALAPAGIAAKGLKLARDRGATDPANAIAILDAIRPLVIDTRPLDAVRLDLLRKWAAAEPSNLKALVPLASLLEQQGDLAGAKKLLLPVKSQLGDTEGARVLGTILSREGDLDGAYALLWPYVDARLARLHDAEKAEHDVGESLWHREVQELNDQKGPSDFYARYKAASTDAAKDAVLSQYVNGRIKDDPEFIAANKNLEHEAGVVPVALDLGMVMLERAQGQANPADRKTQLEATEKVFLAVGGVASESDVYRVSLGQVYYWLGKQADGHKLFDEYLSSKSRQFKDLLTIAEKLRQVGAVPEARAMMEEAYAKGADEKEKHAAAHMRAVCDKDLDDEILWLNRADTANPSIRAALAKAQGNKAVQEGREQEAVKQFHDAIDAYSAMPRGPGTANETALAYYGIFMVTGDRADMQRCADFFQQALDLAPSDSILQHNAAETLLEAAITDVIAGDIDLHALHQGGSTSLLGYLYKDEAGRAAVAKRVADHPGIARALGYFEKAMLLSPKNGRGYEPPYHVHRFVRNQGALRTLAQRLDAADIDTGDQAADVKDTLSGAKDEQTRTAIAAALKRRTAAVDTVRAKGGLTAAVAMDELAEVMLTADTYDRKTNADEVLKLARDAYAIAPSTSTRGSLIAALLFRAHNELRKANPAFDSFCRKYERSLGCTYTMAFCLGDANPFQSAVRQHKDIREAIALTREECTSFPQGRSLFDWALLRGSDAPDDAAETTKTAEFLRADERTALDVRIDNALHPAHASTAMHQYWYALVQGKSPAEAKQAFAKVASLNVPVPVQP